MTHLFVDNIDSTTGSGTITVDDSTKIYAPGQPTQVSWIRSDNRATWTTSYITAKPIRQLELTFTPLSADSLIIITYMINYEVYENAVFVIFENDLPLEMGWPSNTYAGIASAYYDADQATTLANICLSWITPALSTKSRTYAPGFKSSANAANTITMNRGITSAGADGQESAISTGLIMEIPQ